MNDDKWLQQNQEAMRKHLDACVDEMDASSLSRLRQARQRALDSGGQKAGFNSRHALPVGLAVAASLLLVILLGHGINDDGNDLYPDLHGQHGNVVATLADMDLLAAQEQTEFYENLDFYEWLVLEQSIDNGMTGEVSG